MKCCSKCSLTMATEACHSSAYLMFVGLSGKIEKNKIHSPLSSETNSGRIIDKIVEKLNDLIPYKTNLVKCSPVDDLGKMRYPSAEEMENCYPKLNNEITILDPKVVVLLGSQVSKFVLNKMDLGKKVLDEAAFIKCRIHQNRLFISTYHPSYMQIYKNKHIEAYAEQISNAANKFAF